MYAERTAAIEGQIAEAGQAQAEAQELLERYTAQLAEARQEAAKIREDAREQGSQIVAEMRAKAQAEAQRITDAHRRRSRPSASRPSSPCAARSAGWPRTSPVAWSASRSRTRRASVARSERFLAELEAAPADATTAAASVQGS